TVITGEHDDRVLVQSGLLECCEDAPHLVVHERDHGEVRAARLGELGGGVLRVAAGCTRVGPLRGTGLNRACGIELGGGGHGWWGLIERIMIQILLRCAEPVVRIEEVRYEEERGIGYGVSPTLVRARPAILGR